MDFQLVPSRYADIVPLLRERAPTFFSSEHYRQHAGAADDLPGVLLWSFGRFLTEMSVANPNAPAVSSGLQLIEEMLSWNDGRVTASVQDEFFEAICEDSCANTSLWTPMSPGLRRSYDAWRA